MDGRVESVKNCEDLKDYMFSWSSETDGEHLIFQQDNAPILTARQTKCWFLGNVVDLLEWPARIPYVNPIETLWAILAQDVYANGRQYSNVETLKASIVECWSRMSSGRLKNLTDSILRRLKCV